MKIVIPDKIDISDGQLLELRALGATVFRDTPKGTQELITRLEGAEIITAKFVDITQTVIDAIPSLKYIISAAAGYDAIDVKYANEKDIKVINCPTHNSLAVAEHAVALLFALARHIKPANDHVTHGGWDASLFVGIELGGKRVGLIGHGNIGKHIEKLAIGLGMSVSAVNSASRPEEINSLIEQSDALVICAQLNKDTRHLIDAKRLSSMKKSAFLINISRGAIIDQAALIKALEAGSIRGAGLDVFEDEPSVGSAPPKIVELARLPNVLITPHLAYNTEESAARLGDELIKNIKAIIEGNPINLVKV